MKLPSFVLFLSLCAPVLSLYGEVRTLTLRQALDQAVSPQDWNTLFLSSPEFMR